ncbi:hypothetical protein RHSIM_Rhsim02G0223300 [Rhododendron simsii]|uniref:Ribosomal RNA small subunit methyltransferase NEP1 n=1 Tax=Rhododendron simsii TaxID=118357 RepID=A0A834H8N6_RHOSS|nr:hypothetical protein RHSIM_Rhsim02G0223300 [Rhododendron simsii]
MGDEVEKRKEDDSVGVVTKDNEEDDDCSLVPLFAGIPLAPSIRNPKPPRVTFVVEKASLVPAYVGRSYHILNPEEHADFLRKKNMNPYDYRPDIVHEALLQITGSQLCKAGGVEAVYIKTVQGVLIKVEPPTHIPKTLGLFCAMMSQLLQKLNIKARGKGEKLLRLVENPVTKHLPLNSHIIGLSSSSKKAVRVRDYIGTISNDQSLVFVVGAMAHGKIDSDYINDFVSGVRKWLLSRVIDVLVPCTVFAVSSFPLSAAACLRRICIAVERQRNIL